MTTFQAGRQYQARSIGDHNCISSLTVARRTAKTITTAKGKTYRVSVYRDEEQVFPDGHYSMAQIIGANDTKSLATDWGATCTEDTH
jgi:hypothetical protein